MGKRSPLALRQALALGLLHGPSELLPISSSAHTALVPWLLGWRYGELHPSTRKSFEVALHAGTAVGLLAHAPWRGGGRGHRAEGSHARARGGGCAKARSSTPGVGAPGVGARFAPLVCAALPPALVGYALGEHIEERLGTPVTIAGGLLAGAMAMTAAELGAGGARADATATASDGLALGAAQALALMPGLSRSGISFATARARGFARADADRLSWKVGLPVIAGAALLEGTRLARGGIPAELRPPFAVGGASALLSTHLSVRLLTPERRSRLLPAAIAYRVALAALVIRRVRNNTGAMPRKSK
jgi:undecaprenyl-diphosphatase